MLKIIKEVTKKDLEDFIYNIDVEDENLYTELQNPDMLGIFQLSGTTAKRLVSEIQPINFDEVNATNAMSRPGPIENSGGYISQKNGASSPYPEIVQDILKETYGVLLFQEQILEVFHKIGGFSLEEADEIRNLMKRLGKAEKAEEDLKRWDVVVKKFVKGATKNEIKQKMALKIAEDLKMFSSYSFNKAHATSYSYIAIITLYLSYYFREYFYSALITDETGSSLSEKLVKIRTQGINIVPPDINKSDINFSPISSDSISFGLRSIKGVSETSSGYIVENRPYKSFLDFVFKTRSRTVTSAVIKALISVGVFDEFFDNRKKLLFIFTKFWEEKKTIKVEEKLRALFEKKAEEAERIPGLETTSDDLIEYENTYFGFNFFTSPFSEEKTKAFNEMSKRKLISLSFNEVSASSRKTPVFLSDMRSFKDKNDNDMAFLTVEDLFGKKESIPLFYSYYQHIGEELETGKIYLFNLYRNDDDQVMFGQSAWIRNPFMIKRMIKKI
tara:strand:- start:2604 stop:4106 length:1503 start_codon:yes stop_codon:yes gene_type:complete